MLKLYQCRQDSASNAPPTGITRWRRGIGIMAGLLMTMAATAASASTPYLGSPFSEPGTQINAADFDAGSAGDAYSVANTVSPASTSYRNTPVPLFATSDPGRGYAVDHNLVPGDWLAYTTNFTTGGSFDIAIRAATANQDGTGLSGRFVHLEVDGVNVTGSINLAPTSSWTTFATTTISSVAIPSGSHKLKFVVESPVGQFGFNWIQIAQHQTFTYYVSPSGNDSNNGTSTSTPWRTLAKVNSFPFGPGDTVLFQRGGEWHEVLNPLVDGRASNPITFADYGTGNKPKFWGSDFVPINDSGWVPQGGNVYTHAWSQQVNSVLANHQFLIDIFNGGTGDGSVVRDPSNTPNCWKWSGGVLTISTNGSDPRTDGRLYSLCVRDNVICNGNQLTFNLHSHLVFRNLVVDECGSNQNPTLGYGCRITGNGTTTGIDVLVDGVEVYRYGRHGFAVIDGSQVTFNNCYCAYPMPNVQTGQTGYVSYGDQGPALSETSVYNNCVAEHQADTWNGAADFEYQAFTDHGPSLGSVTLNNFQAIDSGGNGVGDGCTFDGANGATITVKGGICYSAQVQSLGPNVTIDGMKIYGPGASMDIAGSGTVIQNCIVAGTTSAPPYNAAIWLRGPNPIFRFNTVVTGATAGNSFTALSLASLGSTNGTNAQVYGNVLYAPQLSVNSFTSSNTFNAAMVKDNLYNNGATFQLNFGTVMNLSQWQAQGYDAGSIQTATPGFSNPSLYDYSLTSTSPAINAAPIGTTTPAMPGLDFLGNPRKVGANYDIGAYEYQGGTPAAPVISSAATASGTAGTAFSYQITASNSPTSYSASGLPTGLSINTSTGLISGTPSASGTSTVTLGATNVGGTGNKNLTITISAVGGTGTGLRGNYYNTQDLTGSIILSRIDSTVNVDWGTGSPDPSINVDHFSARWLGQVQATTTGSYTFSTNSDDGVRLWVNGTQIINNWTDHAPVIDSGTISLTAGQKYDIKLEYYENGGGAAISLYWTPPGGSQAVIPASQLYPAPATPVISSAATATGTVGTAFTYTITASNSPTSFSAPGLPAGLTVNTTTGVISGTPTTAGTSTVTLSATNTGGTGNKTLTITISAAPAETPYGGTAWPIPGLIQVENYDNGGEGIAYHDTDTGNTGGAYRSDNVDIRAVVNDAGGGYQVGWTGSGEYLKYTVNVTAAGSYVFNVRVASGDTGGTLHFNVDGTNATGTITVPGTGSYDTFTTVSSGSVSLTAGQHVITLYEDSSLFDINWFSVTAGNTPYNVNAIYTTGTTFSTGGLDSYGNAYVSSELGSSITYNGSSFTFGSPNVLDGWSSTTVNLPTGTYTTLDMVGTASGGIANSQTFTVTYMDNTTQAFTLQMTDWTNNSPLTGETKIKTMADAIASNGTLSGASHYLSGYTFTLNGKTPKSITLPAARGVVVLGFAGH